MKKLVLVWIGGFFAISFQVNAQVDTVAGLNKHAIDVNTYTKKSKHQKTAAWVMLTGGLALVTTGLILTATDDTVEDLVTIFSGGTSSLEKPNRVTAPILTAVGAGAMLGSIPLFISSKKNARKATLALANEYAPKSVNSVMVFQSVPSVRLTVPIR